MTKHILVTGAAGFIGFHLCARLIQQGYKIVGLDNMSAYYDPCLKQARLDRLVQLQKQQGADFDFVKMDLAQADAVKQLFGDEKFDIVVNLAAQAGVRYSLENPQSYIDANLNGFLSILEACRAHPVEHLVFASSSSIYGMNHKIPFAVADKTDAPISLYAATKKSNELMAHAYAHLFDIPTTGLRFFTVYGPYGRPDMAYYKFTQAISEGRAIDVFNEGAMERDFTFIDDIVEGIMRLIPLAPEMQTSEGSNAQARFKMFNIGNNNPVTLSRFIEAIENALGKKAVKNMLPMQPGDVPVTYADIDDLSAATGFAPKTNIEDGINLFVSWYKDYQNSNGNS